MITGWGCCWPHLNFHGINTQEVFTMHINTNLSGIIYFALLSGALLLSQPIHSADLAATYEGKEVCIKCHDLQGETFEETVHAKAFDSLKPKVKSEAKQLASLDPTKDYTNDTNCIGCHTTGYGEPGGYNTDLPGGLAKALRGVTCEACHGAGSIFREQHGEAENKLKREGEYTDRKVLIAAGQNYDYEAKCVACHLNYEGSDYSGTHPPFTPFTPTLDEKYKFDFIKSVMHSGENGIKSIHEHFKLIGVFQGEAPALRDELQKNAIDPNDY
ncbi:MAG: cytochrome C554 [Sedimenticola selenatireducens]|uniref:Cytochrome C554 n=3 Tax=Sedimenticola TaxID=349742 RepID=A0A558CRV4_9GAMM|nr:MAG: cytochrome C554 [Sedimenticola selenatireducens]TVO68314.1 cytochrome C554 [Sedimenticola selenatireducens]TVT51504.1 MAG: cytochrome C554 [Sedimenticola thiotaurini]TVT60913.1 MAG: cytochrome C554 [Sedimenticola selenatireducens]